MLNQQIEKIIDELGIGCVSICIDDNTIFSQSEILFLNENDIEIWGLKFKLLNISSYL